MLLLVFLLSGCAGLMRDIEVNHLAQNKQHHDVIRILQWNVDQKKPISSFQLYLLANAYYEIRDDENMLKATALLEEQLSRGDTRYYGADFSVYPGILRGYASLDQGDYEKAVKEATEAYTILKRSGDTSNGFYQSQLIDIMGILGIAHACLNNDAEADRCLDVLRSADIQGILGPEKFFAIARVHMARKQYQQALLAIRDPAAEVSVPAVDLDDETFQGLSKVFILTKSLYETGQMKEAREGYDALLKHPRIKQVGGLYWPMLLDRARIARAEGQDKVAEALLRVAVDAIERERSSITSEAGRTGYAGDKQAVYQELTKWRTE